ncbi:MAG: squalene--hopene cyclase [Wenzhouxiangellaceae bacterium]
MSSTRIQLASALEAATTGLLGETLEAAIERAVAALLKLQNADGHWCFELEADCTIPAEYILFMHYLGDIDSGLQERMANYLRRNQNAEGGWPLYHGGELDLSCTVKVYYALKLAGESIDADHMRRARAAIIARGGAERSNVFTRITLAMFAQVPWRAVPYMPPEIMLLPRWFPFHLSRVAYWSRTVMVPLFIIYALKPQALNPRRVGISELFVTPADQVRDYFPVRSTLNRLFLLLERTSRLLLDPLVPGRIRRLAIRRAERWITERLNGEDGLGAIFPAMVNAYIVLCLLDYDADHPLRKTARQALDKLVVDHGEYAYCQPCVSPIWDTGITCLALQETAQETAHAAARRGLDWLAPLQLTDEAGDWRDNNPQLTGGGWPFQYANPHYPDLDDTAMIAWAMEAANESGAYQEVVTRAADWLAGMQSRNGGFAAFDRDNTYFYLNEIPFADHGALLDPPTADVSGRVLAVLGRLNRTQDEAVRQRCLVFLQREQEADGSWFGRWGTNYIYGTWSVLTGLEQAGVNMREPWIARAASWLDSRQHDDGGWGETNDSYADLSCSGRNPYSTAHHTAWALLALLALGDWRRPSVEHGVRWLLQHQDQTGLWSEDDFTAPGFPRVFYLKYHGYARYFPLWALARYQRLRAARP